MGLGKSLLLIALAIGLLTLVMFINAEEPHAARVPSAVEQTQQGAVN